MFPTNLNLTNKELNYYDQNPSLTRVPTCIAIDIFQTEENKERDIKHNLILTMTKVKAIKIINNVTEHNKTKSASKKISFSFDSEKMRSCDEDSFVVIRMGYTFCEIKTLLKLEEYRFLGELLDDTSTGRYFSDLSNASLNDIEKKYDKMSKEKTFTLEPPSFDQFTGKDDEIQKVLSSLLTDQEGILIGEDHSDDVPKQVLGDHMHYLASMGVKTLFLEHCCYDSAIQIELDRFFTTKKASPFLKTFLIEGFGGFLKDLNYYNMVEAAVKAGIRPIGLEKSNTQGLGYSSYFGSDGKDRMLGLNVGAKEIIEKHKQEGKYIALIGSAHLSYHCEIAGLSELCNVPSLIIEEAPEDIQKSSYETNLINLNLTDKETIQNTFKNKENDYFVDVRLRLNPPS